MNDDDMMMWANVTELGNSLFLVILSFAISIYLFLMGYRREPLAMILAFFVPAAIIGTLKIAFYTCHINVWGIVSPSGHAAISISVLGVTALILSKLLNGIFRALIPVFLVLLAAIIAISRIILGMHTGEDVIIGSLIGMAVVIAIAKLILSYRVAVTLNEEEAQPKKIHPLILGVLVIVATVACYEIKLPSEQIMGSIAKQIRTSLVVCSDSHK